MRLLSSALILLLFSSLDATLPNNEMAQDKKQEKPKQTVSAETNSTYLKKLAEYNPPDIYQQCNGIELFVGVYPTGTAVVAPPEPCEEFHYASSEDFAKNSIYNRDSLLIVSPACIFPRRVPLSSSVPVLKRGNNEEHMYVNINAFDSEGIKSIRHYIDGNLHKEHNEEPIDSLVAFYNELVNRHYGITNNPTLKRYYFWGLRTIQAYHNLPFGEHTYTLEIANPGGESHSVTFKFRLVE